MTCNNVSWAVQSNLVNQIDIEKMREAASTLGHQFYEYTHILFSGDCDLSHIPEEEKVIFYGSTASIKNLSEKYSYKWKCPNNKWVFYTDQTVISLFNAKEYTGERGYGPLCLNEGDWVTIRELKRQYIFWDQPYPVLNYAIDGMIFILPNDGDKSFSGHLISIEEFKNWVEEVSNGDYPGVNNESWIYISSPKNIDSEFRCWLVDGEVVSISMYRSQCQIQRGRIYEECPIYNELSNFAIFCDRLAKPAPVYCLDIALYNDVSGKLIPWVVENNFFHSSGWYQADILEVMRKIDNYEKRRK